VPYWSIINFNKLIGRKSNLWVFISKLFVVMNLEEVGKEKVTFAEQAYFLTILELDLRMKTGFVEMKIKIKF
jgi:hypothetical protein